MKTFITCLLVCACFVSVSDAEMTSEYLTASDGMEMDRFGWSVAISGDYALVGTLTSSDDKGKRSGSVYVFRREGASWTEQAKLTASDGEEEDRFGCSVAIWGDYALVGATGGDGRVANSGCVYVFHREGTSWTQQVKLTASDGAQHEGFGCSVAIWGDHALVGAYQDDDKGKHSGSAYIFHREGASWTQQVKLTASDGEEEDLFGRSVALFGDYALVGASWGDGRVTNSGSAYIFHHRGIWKEQAKLTASGGREKDRLGGSVALSGDYALVGADWHDGSKGENSGSAYIFHREGTSWTQQATPAASDRAERDYFGRAVALSGDYALVGAPRNDGSADNSGSAYIFHREGTSWTLLEKIVATYGGEGYSFGGSVALSGGYAILGSTGDDYNGSYAGSAYIFEFSVPGVPVVTDVTVEPNPVEQGQMITIRAKGAIR